MECPKCSAVQADGRDECASCGVVFARFREAQERALLRRTSLSQQQPAAYEPPLAPTAPRWLALAAVVIVLVLGIAWTAKRRSERATRDLAAEGSAMLDEINNKGVAQRRRLQEEAMKARQSWEASAVGRQPATGPLGLDVDRAKALLEQCVGFTRIEHVEIPKVVPDYGRGYTLEQYPALSAAENSGAVALEKEGSNFRVTLLPSVSGRMQVSETESSYVITVGRRHVKTITNLYGAAGSAQARFTYDYEDSYAAGLLLKPNTSFEGNVNYVQKNGTWQALSARPDQKGRTSAANLCS